MIQEETDAGTAAGDSDLDAVSSASVNVSDSEAKGLIRILAEDIQTRTGGDLFSIQTSVDYPSDIKNLKQYDTIFIGYPKMEYGFNCVSCI